MKVPDWFERALAVPRTSAVVDVGGAAIHHLRWGEPGRPGLVFVHGGAAHAHWWSHVAPLFADDYRIVALDLSGHGDSGARAEYGAERWAEEILAVAASADMAGPPIVIGHSMGGYVTIATAALHPDAVAGAIVLDSPVERPDPEVAEAEHGTAFRNPKSYPDLDAAIAHFRTVPEQDHYEPYVLRHVAEHSLRRTDDGWTWKFDKAVFAQRRVDAAELLSQVRCRVAVFRSEHGLLTADIGAYMYEQLGHNAPVIEIPDAGHHMMLDQPLPLVTGLRAILADWEHSVPHRRR